jgi:hypothetical protein
MTAPPLALTTLTYALVHRVGEAPTTVEAALALVSASSAFGMTEGVATTDLSQESARDLLTALLEGEANDGDLTAA